MPYVAVFQPNLLPKTTDLRQKNYENFTEMLKKFGWLCEEYRRVQNLRIWEGLIVQLLWQYQRCRTSMQYSNLT